jgi:hypothetical protein
VILFDEWTEAQVKAFRLMVNRLVTWAEYRVRHRAVPASPRERYSPIGISRSVRASVLFRCWMGGALLPNDLASKIFANNDPDHDRNLGDCQVAILAWLQDDP